MRKNYCIGGPKDGEIVECDDRFYGFTVVTKCAQPGPSEAPTSTSKDFLYRHSVIQGSHEDLHLLIYGVKKEDLLKHLLDSYCRCGGEG